MADDLSILGRRNFQVNNDGSMVFDTRDYPLILTKFRGPFPIRANVYASGEAKDDEGDIYRIANVAIEYHAPILTICGLEDLMEANGWNSSTIATLKCQRMAIKVAGRREFQYELYFAKVESGGVDCNNCGRSVVDPPSP